MEYIAIIINLIGLMIGMYFHGFVDGDNTIK